MKGGDKLKRIPINLKFELIEYNNSGFSKGKCYIAYTDQNRNGSFISKEAFEKGQKVYVLGVGSPDGSPIKLPGKKDYLKDKDGKVVMSSLDEDICKSIAEAGGGKYFHVDNSTNAQDELLQAIDKIQKSEIDIPVYSQYKEQFQVLAFIVLLLLVLDTIILKRKSSYFDKLKLFRK